MASTARLHDDGAPRPVTVGTAPAGLTTTDLLLMLMALLWGVNFIVVKFGTRAIAPLAFNAARIALAVAVLWAIVLLRRQSLPAPRDLARLLGLGLLGNGLYQILFIEGMARTRASDASLILAASPAMIEIIVWIRGLERIGWRGMGGIALSLVGIALVISGAPHGAAGDSTFAGDALIVAACLCWAVFSVLLKPFTERVDGIILSAVTMSGGMVALVAVGAPALLATRWASVTPMAWGAVAYSGIAALVIAYLCWYQGVRMLGPTRASMYANLQPIVAMGAAWLLLAEAPTLSQVVGAACIMAGLLLTRLPSPTPMAGE